MGDEEFQSDHDMIVLTNKTVLDMNKRLFGNGQQGALKDMDDKTNNAFGRIKKLEKAMWLVLGGGILAMTFKDSIIEALF